MSSHFEKFHYAANERAQEAIRSNHPRLHYMIQGQKLSCGVCQLILHLVGQIRWADARAKAAWETEISSLANNGDLHRQLERAKKAIELLEARTELSADELLDNPEAVGPFLPPSEEPIELRAEDMVHPDDIGCDAYGNPLLDLAADLARSAAQNVAREG